MQIVFLDFDGVLVTPSSLFRSRGPAARADPEAVAALNHITETTGARIVVTSTWRLEYSPGELREILSGWGVPGLLADPIAVPDLGRRIPRGEEIQEWIQTNPDRDQLESFVILDDKNDMGGPVPALVRTDFDTACG
jgi:hypothetical protein